MPSSQPLDLDGTWQPVDATMGGAPFPVAAFAGAKLTLGGGRYSFGIDQGTCRVVSGGAPGAMEITGEQGPNAGRTIAAAFEVEGDELRVCYQLGSGERPLALEAPAGTQLLLIRYRRAT